MVAPALKNESVKISQLVADYRAGRLVIPEFQRDYVWRKSKAPKLIDSLYRRFPRLDLVVVAELREREDSRFRSAPCRRWEHQLAH